MVVMMVVVTVAVAAAAAEVEAPRDLPHARRDHLGRAPDPGRQGGGREGLAVRLGEVEVRVVGQEEVPGRSREGLPTPLFQDEPSSPLPRQLHLWWKKGHILHSVSLCYTVHLHPEICLSSVLHSRVKFISNKTHVNIRV